MTATDTATVPLADVRYRPLSTARLVEVWQAGPWAEGTHGGGAAVQRSRPHTGAGESPGA